MTMLPRVVAYLVICFNLISLAFCALVKRDTNSLDRDALIRSVLPVMCVTENMNYNSTIQQCWDCFNYAKDNRAQEVECAKAYFKTYFPRLCEELIRNGLTSLDANAYNCLSKSVDYALLSLPISNLESTVPSEELVQAMEFAIRKFMDIISSIHEANSTVHQGFFEVIGFNDQINWTEITPHLVEFDVAVQCTLSSNDDRRSTEECMGCFKNSVQQDLTKLQGKLHLMKCMNDHFTGPLSECSCDVLKDVLDKEAAMRKGKSCMDAAQHEMMGTKCVSNYGNTAWENFLEALKCMKSLNMRYIREYAHPSIKPLLENAVEAFYYE